MSSLRVVIGGVNGTGKSTFACSLYIALQCRGVSVALHELDVYSDTHGPLLGLKPWDQRRGRSKANFKQTILPAILAFEADEHAIVLGDLPGKVSNPFLPEMIRAADQGILIGREKTERDLTAKHPQSFGDWKDFVRRHHIPVVAEVHSMLSGQAAWEGTIGVGGMNRALAPMKPAVQEVADLLIRHYERFAGRGVRTG